jgi:hypothetical protein
MLRCACALAGMWVSLWIPIPIAIPNPKKENHNKRMHWPLILRAKDPQRYQDPIG